MSNRRAAFAVLACIILLGVAAAAADDVNGPRGGESSGLTAHVIELLGRSAELLKAASSNDVAKIRELAEPNLEFVFKSALPALQFLVAVRSCPKIPRAAPQC